MAAFLRRMRAHRSSRREEGGHRGRQDGAERSEGEETEARQGGRRCGNTRATEVAADGVLGTDVELPGTTVKRIPFENFGCKFPLWQRASDTASTAVDARLAHPGCVHMAAHGAARPAMQALVLRDETEECGAWQ